MSRVCVRLAVFAATLSALGRLHAQPAIEPERRFASVVALLEDMITHEMRDKDIPALSIALVDSQRVVWARGFGWADSAKACARLLRRCTASGPFPSSLPISR